MILLTRSIRDKSDIVSAGISFDQSGDAFVHGGGNDNPGRRFSTLAGETPGDNADMLAPAVIEPRSSP